MKPLKSPILNILAGLALAVIAGGCTSIESADVYNDQLQDKILTENYVEPGDHVIVSTNEGKYEFKVEEVTGQSISGTDEDDDPVSVEISDIVALDKKEFDATKTAGAVAGGVGWATLAWIALIALAVGWL